MSNENTNITVNQLIALSAIASTEPQQGQTEDQWLRAVIRRANTVSRMRLLDDDGLMMQILGSVKIPCTITGVEYEESSTRYVITFVADNATDGEETIRTNRTDNKSGQIILQDIEKLKSCIGTEKKVLIYKYNAMPTEEQIERCKRENKRIPSNGYRQAVWFEFLD